VAIGVSGNVFDVSHRVHCLRDRNVFVRDTKYPACVILKCNAVSDVASAGELVAVRSARLVSERRSSVENLIPIDFWANG